MTAARPESASAGGAQRLDRWLWYARFVKTRTLATKLCASGRIRVNGKRTAKPSQPVRAGDVLTFPLARHIRVIEVKAPGARRGPASEARLLYDDLDPPAPARRTPEPRPDTPHRPPGAGRPTKKDRRDLDALRKGP